MDVLLWRCFVCLWFAAFFYLRRKERMKRKAESEHVFSDGGSNRSLVPAEKHAQEQPIDVVQTQGSGGDSKPSATAAISPSTSSSKKVAYDVPIKSEISSASVISDSSVSTAASLHESRASAAMSGVQGEAYASSISPKKSGYFELDPAIHIEIRPGMEKHMQQIERLRELIKQDVPQFANDEWVLNDKQLWRYLVARKLDIEGARKQAVAALKWRDFRRPEEIRYDDIKVELETGKIGLRGIDRHGRPVVVLDSSKENTWDQNGNMKGFVYTLNRAMKKLEDPVDKYVLVVRLGDTSMFNFSKLPGPSQVRETAKIMMTVFAERLGHAIVYQPPKIFTIFLNLFRSVFDAHVLSKAVWITGDVSPGSPNDISLCELLGPHWREIIGEGQPIHNPKWAPGYNSSVELAKMLQEEQDEDGRRGASAAKDQKQPSRKNISDSQLTLPVHS